MDDTKKKVLIAEDSRTSRMIIQRLLGSWGFEAVSCKDGLQAQEALAEPDGPRIAILDWVMPGRTGPEVCAWIGEELDFFVYTILLTSKTEREDMLTGLTAGAHAYIRKPADPTELKTWIEVGLRITGYESELAKKSEELQRFATQMETLAEERASQLVHADRMVTLGTMSAGIAHEINNSATLLSGNVQTLEKFWPVVDQSLHTTTPEADEESRLGFILEEVPNILGGMREGVSRISKIVKGLKTFSHREKSDDLEPTQVNDCIHSSLELCENALKRTASSNLKLDPELPTIMAAPHQLEQVFVNMIVNACDAVRPTAPGEIIITTEQRDEDVIVQFEDTGPGISPELMEKIWDPFFTTKGIGKGTGLGLSISLGIIEGHGGRYTVENRDEGGARFTMILPIRAGDA